MKTVKALLFMLILTSSPAFSGGSMGGGSGGSGIMLELERAEITREEFSRLVIAGMKNDPIAINSLPARVQAVNFQALSIEVNIQGIEEPLTLNADPKE